MSSFETPSRGRAYLEQSAQEFLNSPQALIRSFLSNAVPAFPEVSESFEEAQDSSADPLAILQAAEEEESMEASSSSSSSFALSLPDSFLDLPPRLANKPSAPPPPISVNTLSLEYKEQVKACRELLVSMEVQLGQLLQAHGVCLSSAQATQKTLQSECQLLQERCARLTALLDEETAQRAVKEGLASRCSTAEEEVQRLRHAQQQVQTLFEQQAATLTALQTSSQAKQQTFDEHERKYDLLVQDKQYLSREVEGLQAKLAVQMETNLSDKQRILALEEKLSQQTNQLVQINQQNAHMVEEKVEQELARIRSATMQEIESIKSTSKEISDREVRALLEVKISLEGEVQDLRRRYDQIYTQLQAVQGELLVTQQSRVTETTELRAELKIKNFEITTMGVTFEQRMSQFRQTELELEAAKQEINAHKSALLRLEGEKEAMVGSLQASLDQCKNKLEAYEALEVEIDDAVLRTAQHPHGGESSSEVNMLTVQQQQFVLRGLPSHPQRRIAQAVHLAQRLLESDKRNAVLSQQVQELEGIVDPVTVIQSLVGYPSRVFFTEKLRGKEIESDAAKVALSRAAQPTQYLVAKLRDEEALRAKAEKRCEGLKAEVQSLRQRGQQAQQETQALRDRLVLLLQQRGELQTVKAMLEELHAMHEEEEEDSSSSDEDEEDDDDDVRSGVATAASTLANVSLVAGEPTIPRAQRKVESEEQEVRRPPPPRPSLQSRSIKLGLRPELLQQMLRPPNKGEGGEREVVASLPGLTIKSYRRQQMLDMPK
eukprot:gene1114-1217_t